jgi:hypothetical protein
MRTLMAAIGVAALIPLAACSSGTSHAQQVKVCERYLNANFRKYWRNGPSHAINFAQSVDRAVDGIKHRPAQCEGVTISEMKLIMTHHIERIMDGHFRQGY